MPMITIVFYGLLTIAVFLSVIGVILNPKISWLAGLVWYVVSFWGSWSIGLYLLVFPFTLWTFALAHILRFIKKPTHTVVCLAVGILLWIVSINVFDDYWLFYPFSHLLG
ncbi:hypothetical protein SD71_07360 [Cohnella kolymensis]|uniref:Uncharacterized protein n=1 Tax=Cohnella kolymensis TaxID=1590652 RepID=A0ABR5A5X8_9BACL|nr:hypothetical protein SD71_07360 [Cohnella kolymensis]